MNKDDCFVLGKLTKPHGYKGAMVLFVDADEPEAYIELESVWMEVDDRLVPHFINTLHPHNTANKFIVQLEGIDSESKAKTIAGCTAYLPSTMLPQLDGNSFYLHEVNGWKVKDNHGVAIGIIQKVLDYPMYPILEVHAEAHNKEILIPLPEQVEIRVDRESKALSVNLPEGLLEAYLDSDAADEEEDDWRDGDESR